MLFSWGSWVAVAWAVGEAAATLEARAPDWWPRALGEREAVLLDGVSAGRVSRAKGEKPFFLGEWRFGFSDAHDLDSTRISEHDVKADGA